LILFDRQRHLAISSRFLSLIMFIVIFSGRVKNQLDTYVRFTSRLNQLVQTL